MPVHPDPPLGLRLLGAGTAHELEEEGQEKDGCENTNADGLRGVFLAIFPKALEEGADHPINKGIEKDDQDEDDQHGNDDAADIGLILGVPLFQKVAFDLFGPGDFQEPFDP